MEFAKCHSIAKNLSFGKSEKSVICVVDWTLDDFFQCHPRISNFTIKTSRRTQLTNFHTNLASLLEDTLVEKRWTQPTVSEPKSCITNCKFPYLFVRIFKRPLNSIILILSKYMVE
jgi:hypothetical protein